MIKLPTGHRILTAVISLIAVICAVFEHEDLLFQGIPDRLPAIIGAGSDAPVVDDLAGQRPSNWTNEERDRGTEGSFRPEPYQVRAAPVGHQILPSGGPKPKPLRLTSREKSAHPAPSPAVPRSRLRPVATVELRL